MRFDPLSFAIGNHGNSGPVRDVVSYLMGSAVAAAGEIWQTITNVAVASFTTVSSTLRDLVIDVTPLQSGTGDPSPVNQRLISGWTGANIHVNGANLVDGISYLSGYYIAADGTVTAYADAQITDYLPVFPGVGIIWTTGLTATVGGGYRLHGYDKNKQWVSQIVNETKATTSALYLSTVIPSNVAYIRLSMPGSASTSAMECYNGTTFPVSWQSTAGTVYGGTLTDNGNGTWTLTVTHIIYSLPSVDSSSIVVSSYGTRLFVKYSLPTVATEQGDFFYGERCSWITYADRGEVWKGVIGLQSEKLSLFIWIPADSTVESVNTALAGSKIVYPIATPQTYTLTAESVKALLGTNNIFADCGNISTITFRTH